jgi:uncharacterized protein (DUF302 family)
MPINQVAVERVSLVSSKPFAQVVAAIEAAIGHPDMREFWKTIGAAPTWQEVERAIQAALGPSGFMEFTRFDHGQFLRMAQGAAAPRILRIVLGNPLIMKQMAEHVPDAGSYAPVSVLVDERGDGVHISYDRMASYLQPYANLAALKVARELDTKVEALLAAAAE